MYFCNTKLSCGVGARLTRIRRVQVRALAGQQPAKPCKYTFVRLFYFVNLPNFEKNIKMKNFELFLCNNADCCRNSFPSCEALSDAEKLAALGRVLLRCKVLRLM